MPLRWYGPADPSNATYRHFSRVVNLCLHTMGFAAINSGLWFIQQIRHPWGHLALWTESWLVLLIIHFLIVIKLRPGKEPDSAES